MCLELCVSRVPLVGGGVGTDSASVVFPKQIRVRVRGEGGEWCLCGPSWYPLGGNYPDWETALPWLGFDMLSISHYIRGGGYRWSQC